MPWNRRNEVENVKIKTLASKRRDGTDPGVIEIEAPRR